jgi:hypothetical protein
MIKSNRATLMLHLRLKIQNCFNDACDIPSALLINSLTRKSLSIVSGLINFLNRAILIQKWFIAIIGCGRVITLSWWCFWRIGSRSCYSLCFDLNLALRKGHLAEEKVRIRVRPNPCLTKCV